jgi:hypothetical protein
MTRHISRPPSPSPDLKKTRNALVTRYPLKTDYTFAHVESYKIHSGFIYQVYVQYILKKNILRRSLRQMETFHKISSSAVCFLTSYLHKFLSRKPSHVSRTWQLEFQRWQMAYSVTVCASWTDSTGTLQFHFSIINNSNHFCANNSSATHCSVPHYHLEIFSNH